MLNYKLKTYQLYMIEYLINLKCQQKHNICIQRD